MRVREAIAMALLSAVAALNVTVIVVVLGAPDWAAAGIWWIVFLQFVFALERKVDNLKREGREQ